MTKLTAAFALIALIVLAVAYLGLHGTASLTAGITDIGKVRMPSLENLMTIDRAYLAIESSEVTLMQKSLDQKVRMDAYANIEDAEKEASEAINAFGRLAITKGEFALWYQFLAAWNAWWDDHKHFMALTKAYETTSVEEAYVQMVQFKMDTQKMSSQAMQKSLDMLTQKQKNDAVDEVADAERLSSVVRRTSAGAVAVGPLLALLLGTAFSLAITRPLARSVVFAEQLASGNLAHRLDIVRRDEVGALACSLDEMRLKLGGIVAAIRESSEQLASSSAQIHASTLGVAERAQSQAATLEETSASLEELASSVDQVAEHARSQALVVGQGTQSVTRVQQSIEEVSQSFSRISALAGESVQDAIEGVSSVQEVVAGINLIAESTKKIGGILAVISDIADQTNLLALNAAIEAARAGEHGRGFAVVAQEVNKLADRSAASTKEIETLIKDSFRSVTMGVEVAHKSQTKIEKMRQASQTVKETISGLSQSIARQVEAARQLSQAISTVNQMSQSISTATQEQTTNARQVSAAVEAVNAVTQNSASAAEEMSLATEQISNAAEKLRILTAQFTTDVDADSDRSLPVPPPLQRVGQEKGCMLRVRPCCHERKSLHGG
jgi:methyl-accepting chemotaxis protein